jgi:hypothetical protein
MLWNQILHHIGEKGLWALKKKNLVDGLNDFSLEFEFCEHYIYGKQNHVQFYSSSHKSSGLLDLIYFDVFGLVKVPLVVLRLCIVSHSSMIILGGHGYILLKLNLRFLVSLKSLNLSWKIIIVGRLRC